MHIGRRLPEWHQRRKQARLVAVQQISDLYYREGFVPRGTFRRLRREAYRNATPPQLPPPSRPS